MLRDANNGKGRAIRVGFHVVTEVGVGFKEVAVILVIGRSRLKTIRMFMNPRKKKRMNPILIRRQNPLKLKPL
jgi:hypothetical protein